MVVGVTISGVTPSNIDLAVAFVRQNLMMRDADVRKALTIDGFIFYSNKFKTATLTGHSFTVTGIDFTEDFLINIAGNKIEVPTNKTGKTTFTTVLLKAGDYVNESAINLDNIDIQAAINNMIASRMLIRYRVTGAFSGEFSTDFY